MESICLLLLPPSNDRCLPARAPALLFPAPSVVRIKLFQCRKELNEAQRRSTCSLHTGLSWEMTTAATGSKMKGRTMKFVRQEMEADVNGRSMQPQLWSSSKQQQDDEEELSCTMFAL